MIYFIMLYFLIGFLLSLYDLYHSSEILKGENFFIILTAQIILITLWPFYMVKP